MVALAFTVRVPDAPPVRSIVPLVNVSPAWLSVRVLAFCVPLTVTVPAVPLDPAEKITSSVMVVVATAGVAVPAVPLFQRAETPLSQVPVAAPEPAAVLLVSQ